MRGCEPPSVERPRRRHSIAPDEVDAWLADSVNKLVTGHRTTRAAAQDILEQNVWVVTTAGLRLKTGLGWHPSYPG